MRKDLNTKALIVCFISFLLISSCQKSTCPAYQRGGTIDSPKTVKKANKKANKQSGLFGKNMR